MSGRLIRRNSPFDLTNNWRNRSLPHVISDDAARFMIRWSSVFNYKNAIILGVFFTYTVILLYITGSFELESFSSLKSVGNVKYKTLNDLPLSCSAYSLDYRIGEQKRILASVTKELMSISTNLKQRNSEIDDLNRLIPEKQKELKLLEEAIESTRRTLIELQNRKNVRVFLPHSPLSPLINTSMRSLSDVQDVNSDFLDYSRCSISSNISTFLEISDKTKFRGYSEEFTRFWNVVDEKKACLKIIMTNGSIPSSSDGNVVIFNVGRPVETKGKEIILQKGHKRRNRETALFLDVPDYDMNLWKTLVPLLPFSRKNLLTFTIWQEDVFNKKTLENDVSRLLKSADNSSDSIDIIRCQQQASQKFCNDPQQRSLRRKQAHFCVLYATEDFQQMFWESLRDNCIPVVLGRDISLPFEEVIDWNLAALRFPSARLPELHFLLKSVQMSDILEMRRKGRVFFETYLADKRVLVQSLLLYFSHKLTIPLLRSTGEKSIPLFNSSFEAPILTPVNLPPFDDEYLGPLEAQVASEAFNHNFTSFHMYSHQQWNDLAGITRDSEFMSFDVDPPTETEFYDDSNYGFRPIEPGSGATFSKALGGNRQREQFTVVILTYNRDAVLSSSLERLHRLPYLNKVIVIWNNVGRDPIGAWPRLHVPVEFIKVEKNSLNNRFIPWDRIQTEAVLSLDDDIDLKHHEIVFAFRVWRENRDRIVGFPARYHARYGDSMYYNSNHTCQLSMILTGASFLHKSYLNTYTSNMPEAIRHHVDSVMNCEDLAMNFLVSHITRKPPIKTTSKWTLRCPTCTEALWQDDSHFNERHECIRLFTKVYGYNPLKFSQFRADSVLFKTRVPADKQKCFKYV